MIFAHTHQQVISGQKSQTRRIIKYGETFDGERIVKNGRCMYQVGKTYAVQPNRGKKAIARIRLKQLRRETVQDITTHDAHAEGFDSVDSFLETWQRIHGKKTNLNREVWVFEFELLQPTG